MIVKLEQTCRKTESWRSDGEVGNQMELLKVAVTWLAPQMGKQMVFGMQ